MQKYSCVPSPSEQQSSQEQAITVPNLQSNIVTTVVLPDGSKSSLWDQQVPVAFSSYQDPSMGVSSPGPTRKRTLPRSNHCTTCNTYFIRSHKCKNVQSDLRPYVCSICNKAFKRPQVLAVHQRVHTGMKPFSCTLCGRGFSISTDRVVHMVTQACARADQIIRHTSDGWVCTICEVNGSYPSRDQAERHARSHQSGKGLKCPVCQASFKGKKGHHVVKHVKECHSEYFHSLGI